jgi:rod shape-determining protein MreD
MSRFILPEVVYTALVSLLIYHPIHYFCVITEQGKERKKKGKIDEGSI